VRKHRNGRRRDLTDFIDRDARFARCIKLGETPVARRPFPRLLALHEGRGADAEECRDVVHRYRSRFIEFARLRDFFGRDDDQCWHESTKSSPSCPGLQPSLRRLRKLACPGIHVLSVAAP
jgi:hypothetical protein